MKENKVKENQKQIQESLKRYSKMQTEELFNEFGSSFEGISVVDIEEKLDKYGQNSIELKNNNTILHRIKETIINPFNIVLIIVAIVTFVTDVVISIQKDYATFILIVGTIIISAIISLVQETKSDNAAKKLKKMITNKIDVVRDDVLGIVDAQNIVPGDIVKLSAGDMIPGDVRMLEVKDLFIDQASLTRRIKSC